MTRVIVVAGNRNFAHHLWNELTAFEQLVSQSVPLPTRELVIAHEPLGRIDRIFPEIAHWKIHRVPFASMPQALYVNLGGYRISERMRTRMLQHARREVSSDIDSLIQYIKSIAGPVFWISVRTNPPTFENQRELIVAVCRRLLNSNVRCCILLDGFSLPEDWSSTDDATSESYRTLAEASRNEIDAIIGELSHTMRSSSQLLVNAGGIRLLDSIALAQLADAYFCHSGSVQHKIGWTANKPGIIHGPRKALSKAKDPRTWHSERLDEAVPPLPLPRQMIQDVEDDLREKNYRAGCGVVAQFVANYFSYHVRR
jgi:hypothetical protein